MMKAVETHVTTFKKAMSGEGNHLLCVCLVLSLCGLRKLSIGKEVTFFSLEKVKSDGDGEWWIGPGFRN